MKKEIDSKYLKIIILVLIIGFISLMIYALMLKKNLDNYQDNAVDDSVIDDSVIDDSVDMEGSVDTDGYEIDYDCSFTRTYNMVNILDGYISETGFLSYVVLDAFQDRYARVHVVPSKLKEGLENGKRYEFTYTLKGTGSMDDMEDIYEAIQWTTLYTDDREHTLNGPDVSVTLTITETDKVGMEQKQEPICQTN